MKPIRLTVDEWYKITAILRTRYPLSVILIRRKMREVLGFLPRDVSVNDEKTGLGHYEIHIDFFKESTKTMFLLNFAEYISKK